MGYITYEKTASTALVTINRPDALNALNSSVLRELDAVCDTLGRDKELRAVVITGAGEKAFIAGADISEMKALAVWEAREFCSFGNQVLTKIETLPVPVIAAVNGFALGGGCELALACDIRIASFTAQFGQPECGLGIIPGFGGTQRLTRLVGTSRGKELIYTGRIIDASEALRIGLVSAVHESGLLDEAVKMADMIAKQAPIAVKLAKSTINCGINLDIYSGIKLESESFAECFSTRDQKEGMSAFLEKREKSFTNR